MARFSKLTDGQLFVTTDTNGRHVLCQKQDSGACIYDRYTGIRHGELGLNPRMTGSLSIEGHREVIPLYTEDDR